jgi:tetratricopeptide (TPR) repeat protein
VAQMLMSDEKYAESLAMTDRYLTESKSNDPKAYALRGNSLYRLDKFQDAIVALKQAIVPGKETDKAVLDMLTASYFETNQMGEAAALAEAQAAKHPDDKRAQLDLAVIYVNADQTDKAAAVFERLRASGKLTDSSDYEQGAKILSQISGREKDAAAFISEGLDKGILKPSAQVYSLLGQAYYYAEQMPQAITAWEKGAGLSKDGELYLNLAKANAEEERFAAAKAAAQQGLAKGVKHPGDAWTVIGIAERGLGNKAGEIAAYREAAKDPNTRDKANKMLKALGGK